MKVSQEQKNNEEDEKENGIDTPDVLIGKPFHEIKDPL
jgi:hypothetical protein